ncbi:hypothetical protein MHYP_G00350680 [Metynnis hypsauchen]
MSAALVSGILPDLLHCPPPKWTPLSSLFCRSLQEAPLSVCHNSGRNPSQDDSPSPPFITSWDVLTMPIHRDRNISFPTRHTPASIRLRIKAPSLAPRAYRSASLTVLDRVWPLCGQYQSDLMDSDQRRPL